MRFLTSRRGAVLVAVVIVVFSIVLGGGRSLRAERNRILKADPAYEQDVEDVRAIAHNLVTVASRNGAGVQDGSLEALQQALDAEHKDMTALLVAFDQLAETAEAEITDERDAGYVWAFGVDMAGVRDILSRGTYGQLASVFNEETLTRQPARLLAGLFGIEELETFK